MYQKQIKTIKKHLTVKDGQVIATSLDVANFFEKKHKNVLQAIENLDIPAEYRGPNFQPTFYDVPGPNNSTRQEPMYEMTRKGFVLLAMGFTGKQAMKFKVAYIEAFDQMEKALREGHTGLTLAVGNFPAADRPVAVSTPFGHAYVNTATYLLFALARSTPGGEESRRLSSALSASIGYSDLLPEPYRTAEKLKQALLKEKPLWSDILHCQRMGLTTGAIARICGCHPSTVRRHHRKMEECGLFNDPLAALAGAAVQISSDPGVQ